MWLLKETGDIGIVCVDSGAGRVEGEAHRGNGRRNDGADLH